MSLAYLQQTVTTQITTTTITIKIISETMTIVPTLHPNVSGTTSTDTQAIMTVTSTTGFIENKKNEISSIAATDVLSTDFTTTIAVSHCQHINNAQSISKQKIAPLMNMQSLQDAANIYDNEEFIWF